MEYPDNNEHREDDPLENTNNDKKIAEDPASRPEKETSSKDQSPDPVEFPGAEKEASDASSKEETVSESEGFDETASEDPASNKKAPKKSQKKPSDPSEEEEEKSAGGDSNPTVKDDVESVKTPSDQPADDKEAVFEQEESERAEKKHDTDKKDRKQEDDARETVNYELLSKPDLVKFLDDLINNKPFGELRSEVDEIEAVYNRKVGEEMEAKKERFLAEGGLEQDFKPAEDPVDREMGELLEKYRSLKSEFNKQLEDEKEKNLAEKNEILEEFRILMEGQERFDHTFRKFKQLQKRWFDIGIVPKQNVRDLWNSYNFFVDKFNDYVKINRELREMDLQKNYEQKISLCEKAEELAKEKDVSTAFRTLQKYHAQYREIGPVPREHKDSLWERFKAATSVINKAHQEFQSELKESLVDNLEKKRGLCEKAEAIAEQNPEKHNGWVAKTNELLAIQKEWKTIGYAPKKDNNKIYARFRKACDIFFDKKAKFYEKTYEHQKENMDAKRRIIEEADELKDNTDWKSTTDKLIELQKKWKEIGPVPRKESDRLWKKFRASCDHFFNKKSEFFSGKNDSYEDNLKEKKALIEEMERIDPPADLSKLQSALVDFQRRYNEIGFVPVEVKDKIRDDFKSAMNGIIDKTDLPEQERSLMRYRIRITAILNSPRSDSKIRFERDKMVSKLQQLKNDIGVWENNIGFFKETESAEETISEFNEKIEEAHNRIELLEEKVRIIDELEDDI